MVINEDNEFSIDAANNANFGNIRGVFVKIRDGYYYSYIDDGYDSGQACIIILIEHSHKNNIEIIVYGDQVGAGAGVYFDGIYERQPLTYDEYIDGALQYIIGDLYDKNIIRNLLGSDIEYFTGCFGTAVTRNTEHGIFIEGWMRGIAPWQNGIIKIKNDFIYILITDCREDIVFQYYSNDVSQEDIPAEFYNWYYFNHNLSIEKRMIE
jgi:hypothetical protein